MSKYTLNLWLTSVSNGGAGTLAKLSTVSGTAGLLTQFEAQLAPDAHKSFNSRLDKMFQTITLVCSTYSDLCSQYKALVHPHFPGNAPLSLPRHARQAPNQ
jgi:hypothetical protein